MFEDYGFWLLPPLLPQNRNLLPLVAASYLQTIQVPTVSRQQIIVGIGAHRPLANDLLNRNPPDLVSRDKHQTEITAIRRRVHPSVGARVPLDGLAVFKQSAAFDLNGMNRPAPLRDQVECRTGEDGCGNLKVFSH